MLTVIIWVKLFRVIFFFISFTLPFIKLTFVFFFLKPNFLYVWNQWNYCYWVNLTDKHWILAKIPSNLIKFCVLAQIATFSSSKVERLRFLKLNFNKIFTVKLWRENLFQHVIWHAEQVCFYDKGPKNASKGLKSTFFDENCQFRPFRALIRPRVINPKLLSASNYISKLFFPPKFYHENFVKIQCFQMRLGWNKK